MKVQVFESGYYLKMLRGEKIMETLAQFASAREIPSATLSGLGAVCNIKLGFYHLAEKKYSDHLFPEDHELVSLSGNLSYLDGKPIIHAHASISDTDHRVFGGHLFEATVAVTVEITCITGEVQLRRKFDPEMGLNLLDL